MNKKFIIYTILAILVLSISSLVFASDVIIDLESNNTSIRNATIDSNNTTSETSNSTIDNTTYSSIPTVDKETPDTEEIQSPATTTSSYEEDSSELSITNIINIVLIVVGVVLVLLGIAIITRLK